MKTGLQLVNGAICYGLGNDRFIALKGTHSSDLRMQMLCEDMRTFRKVGRELEVESSGFSDNSEVQIVNEKPLILWIDTSLRTDCYKVVGLVRVLNRNLKDLRPPEGNWADACTPTPEDLFYDYDQGRT